MPIHDSDWSEMNYTQMNYIQSTKILWQLYYSPQAQEIDVFHASGRSWDFFLLSGLIICRVETVLIFENILLSPLIIGWLLDGKVHFFMVLEICREAVPNLSGSADQWWQRGDGFVHVPLAQRQLCVLACRLHGPGSQQAMAWHRATDWGLRTPAIEQKAKIWNKINAFITIANQASKFYQSDKSPM